MTANILLIIRISIAIILYAFLGWALYSLWRNLQSQDSEIKTPQDMILSLVIQNGIRKTNKVLHTNVIQIGRHPTNNLQLESETVSAKHAIIRHINNHWWIEDLNSTNGTYINNVRVTKPIVTTKGDHIRCGDIIITITDDESSEKEKE
jgi:pSer/pThr/pTyr-binding forkhead associated (FHA) protein